jgi:hypothetical protein
MWSYSEHRIVHTAVIHMHAMRAERILYILIVVNTRYFHSPYLTTEVSQISKQQVMGPGMLLHISKLGSETDIA